MASTPRRAIVIEILGDAKGYSGAAKKAAAATDTLDSQIRDLGKNIASAYAAKRIVQFGIAAAKAAGDQGESLSKVNVIFKESGKLIDEWSDTSAEAFGMAKTEALDAASTFATFGKGAGLAGDELVGFSTDLTELGTDLASFHNSSPEEAITAIGAALRGESEPIRRFGVLLDDATLKQRAMTLKIYDGTGALSQQQRVLAAQAEILAQTSDAQGDFNRTKEGAANQARILTAQYKDMQVQVGQALLPVMTQLIGVVSSVFSWFSSLEPETQQWLITIGLVGAAVFVGVSAFNALTAALGALSISSSAAMPWLAAIGAAIGLAVAAVEVFSSGNAEAKARADAFYNSVATGVATIDLQRLALLSAAEAAEEYADAVYGEAEKKLKEAVLGNERYVDVMKKLGLGVEDLTTITRGGAEAQELMVEIRRRAIESGEQEIRVAGKVVDANHEAAQAYIQNGDAVSYYHGETIRVSGDSAMSFINMLDTQTEASRDAVEAARERMMLGDAQAAAWLKAKGELDGLASSERYYANLLIDRAAAEEAAATVTEELGDEFVAAATKADLLSEATETTRSTFEESATAASDLKSAIDAVFAPFLNMEQAQRNLRTETDQLAASLLENGATLDLNTAQGIANREQVEANVKSILDFGVAMVGAGESTDLAGQYIAGMTEGLEDQLIAAGLSREEVDAYIATLGLTPENIDTTIRLAEADATKRELEGLLEQLEGIDAGAAAEIKADIANGSFDAARSKISTWARENDITLKVGVKGGGTIAVTPNSGGGRFTVSAYAKGGNPVAGETALVGERGPELVTFGHNSTVHPAGETERILAGVGGGRGGVTYVTEVHVAGSVIRENELGGILSEQSRRQGRDVTSQTRVIV